MIERRASQESILGSIPRFKQHEGDRTTIGREDGTEEVLDFSNPLEATATLKTEDIRERGPLATLTAARGLAEEMARGMTRRMFDTLSEATDAIGNTVNAEGKPFSSDLYLEVLKKLELAFDPEGNWIPPQVAAAPSQAASMRRVLEQAESDPEYRRQRDAIVNCKRKEWRAREADRRLAD